MKPKQERKQNNIANSTKWCPQCKKWLQFRKFTNNNRNKFGLSSYCRSCEKSRRASDKTKRREWWYQKQYGISIDEYNQLLAYQRFCCAICKSKESGGTGVSFHIDHNHATGEIRGLLCHKCNRGLGLFNDSIPTLKEACQYLQSTSREIEDEELATRNRYHGGYDRESSQ